MHVSSFKVVQVKSMLCLTLIQLIAAYDMIIP